MVFRLARSHVAVIYILAGLLAVTHALPVSNVISNHGRCRLGVVRGVESKKGQKLMQSQTLRRMIGDGGGVFAFNSRTSVRDTWRGRRHRFKACPLFSGNNDNMADGMSRAPVTRKNFMIAGILLLVTPIFLEVYSRFGALLISGQKAASKSKEDIENRNDSSFLPPPERTEWTDVEHVSIVFHGAGGQDAYTDELMKKLEVNTNSKSSQQQSSYNHIVDWSNYSTNILQASYNGQKIGKLVAKELLDQVVSPSNKLATIHFIGISVGAFAADAAVSEAKKIFASTNEARNNNHGNAPPFVQLTLLDPFQQRGVFGVGYGNNEFGKSADYAEQYLNTDDPVPSTNKPLKNTVCYDVTGLRPESIFGHDWPLVYYARSESCGQLGIENGSRKKERGKTGTVIVL